MKTKCRQRGLSLTEIAVIIATVALLVGLSVPAVLAFIKSFETGSSTKSIISSALFNARAIAAKEQKYAGVRFQKAYQAEGPLINAPQYMVFIIYDANIPNGVPGNLGCRAVKGLKPIRLPNTVGVMDLTIVTDRRYGYYSETRIDNPAIVGDDYINTDNELADTTTFSILFSPSGKLVIHDLWVLNRDGYEEGGPDSDDDIFNKDEVVVSGNAMFYQDEYPDLGLGRENSRNNFTIYEQKEFKRAYENGQAWSGYLQNLQPFYINAYMGTIIE